MHILISTRNHNHIITYNREQMATLSPNRLSVGSNNDTTVPIEGKKRAVTLSRVATTSSANNSPVKMANNNKEERSEFTRVRRINTLKYVAESQPYRPTLKSKSRSLSGSTSSFYKRYSQEKYRNQKTTSTSSNNEEKEEEKETQEVSLHLRESVSSTSTTSSSGGEGERDGEDETNDHHLTITYEEDEEENITCSKCLQIIGTNDSFILFGVSSLHIDCFKCGQCSQLMGAMEIFLVNIRNEPLCIDCTPNCYTCKGKILQNHISVLKKDFHEECLCCFQCHKKFTIMGKVYASDGEPCCSKCVSPVFSEKWSPAKPRCFSLCNPPASSGAVTSSSNNKSKMFCSLKILSPSPSSDSGVSETASGDNDEVTTTTTTTNGVITTNSTTSNNTVVSKLPENVNLNPQLENLSRSITLYSSNNHTGLRSSFSEPNLQAYNNSLHSLQSVLFDEDGVVLFVNYCTNNDLVEHIVFWLDVEHFKHFDGSNEDLRIFAHHIISKYVGYYAEVPVALPSNLQRSLFDKMEVGVAQDMFNESQDYVYTFMQNEILHGFIQSSDGQAYLQLLADKGIAKITSYLHLSDDDISNASIQSAVITNFDKRRMGTKFYVYEVEVTKETGKYYIYRRYSEWYSLNQSLKKAFPLDKFPPLPKKIFLGRSQKKAVAQQRMTELQVFLQGILGMSGEIVNSIILKRFFKQTEMDKEDEQFNYRIKELQTRRPS